MRAIYNTGPLLRDQSEALLMKGTKYRITRAEERDGFWFINVEEVR